MNPMDDLAQTKPSPDPFSEVVPLNFPGKSQRKNVTVNFPAHAIRLHFRNHVCLFLAEY